MINEKRARYQQTEWKRSKAWKEWNRKYRHGGIITDAINKWTKALKHKLNMLRMEIKGRRLLNQPQTEEQYILDMWGEEYQ